MSSSMIKISEATAIAIHCMVYMAINNDKPASAKEMAQTYEVSEHHLAKVLQRLVKAELLISIKGPHGGFKLGKKPDEINFLQIYEVIEGPIKQGCCLFNKPACTGDCIMGCFLDRINKESKEFFKSKKLSDFISIKK